MLQVLEFLGMGSAPRSNPYKWFTLASFLLKIRKVFRMSANFKNLRISNNQDF